MCMPGGTRAPTRSPNITAAEVARETREAQLDLHTYGARKDGVCAGACV